MPNRKTNILFAFGVAFHEKERTGVGEVYFNILKNVNINVSVISDIYFSELGKKVKQIILGKLGYGFYKYLRYLLPLEIWGGRTEIIISDAFIPKTIWKTKKLYIIHDLMYCLYPENYSKKERVLFSMIYKKLKQSDNILILTVSNTTKHDIVKYLRIQESRIFVFNQTTSFSINRKNFVDNYLLYIGAMRKNKNLLNMLKALKLYNEIYDADLKLIIAGSKKYEYETLIEFVRQYEMSENVVFSGYINSGEKSRLFAGCKALFFCSLYEGFGIPILEAAFNNIPFVISNIPVFNEVIKDSSLLCNPNDPIDIAEHIKLLDSKHYIERMQIIEESIRQTYSNDKYISWLNTFFERLTQG
jgi:glycosyltransferase involved in cell wall biosynthesis